MSTVNNRKDLLRNKGRVYVFNELSTVKDWQELTVVDNIRISHPANPVEIKTPSGISIYKSVDLDGMVSFDWYHPGNLSKIELLFRGAITKSSYDGVTAESNTTCLINFRAVSEAFPLPFFDGDKSAVTVDWVKSEDEATTYTLTTDYTVAVDADTGITHIVQVSGGAIPLNTNVKVQYDYTPLASTIIKPDYTGVMMPRHVMIDVFTNASDLTKYRRYYFPNVTPTSELMHTALEIGKDNTTPNIMPVSLEYAKQDGVSAYPTWYWIDTANV